MRTHLILALARSGWGETTLGLRVADRLAEAGDRAVLVVHPALRSLVEGLPHRVRVLEEVRGPALTAWLGGLVAEHQAASLVLADTLLAMTALRRRAAEPEALTAHRLPVIGIDTWNLAEAGSTLDIGPGYDEEVAAHLVHHPLRLVPVPFARPSAPLATELLPRPEIGDVGAARHAARRGLHLGNGPVVLLCSSSWQHRGHEHTWTERLSRGVPELVVQYLARLGPDVTVLHIGPEPWPWGAVLGDRYRHVSRLPAPRFAGAVVAADVFLSTNVSATTSTLAAVLGVPVVSLINTATATRPSQLDLEAPSPALRRWLATHLPLYPFWMWPLSMARVLSTLLADNPWSDVVRPIELLDEHGVNRVITGLLRDPAARARALGTSRACLDQVRALPGPAERIAAFLGG